MGSRQRRIDGCLLVHLDGRSEADEPPPVFDFMLVWSPLAMIHRGPTWIQDSRFPKVDAI